MKLAVFWILAPFSLVDVHEHLRGTWSIPHHQGLMMEAASISEMLVNIYQTAQCYNPKDSHLEAIMFVLFFCKTRK
jgi:hypothetical protein